MNNKAIILLNLAFVGYEEFCRSRRVLSLLDLPNSSYPTQPHSIIAFVKERFHNAVEIDIIGIFEGYSSLQIWPPQKFFRGEIIQGE